LAAVAFGPAAGGCASRGLCDRGAALASLDADAGLNPSVVPAFASHRPRRGAGPGEEPDGTVTGTESDWRFRPPPPNPGPAEVLSSVRSRRTRSGRPSFQTAGCDSRLAWRGR